MRRRHAETGPGWRRQLLGCGVAAVFLVVAGSLVAFVASVVSTFGPVPALISIVVTVGILAVMGRTLAVAAITLDRMVRATRRVADGDYTVRVGKPGRQALHDLEELTVGFDALVAQLERGEVARQALLADVSHELRTPLAVIRGGLEAVADGIHPADEAHLGALIEETRVLERLVEDLRTVTLSEAGTLPLHPEPVDIELLLGDVVTGFRAAGSAAGVEVTAQVEGEFPIVEVDPVRVREVLSNLVGNALRHTPAGGRVAVTAQAWRDGVQVTVTDTGPGIAAELLPHVFDRFVKGAGSNGSGLGLAIARGLVEAHGGTIGVRSTADAGTTFTVRLPGGG